MGMLDRYRAWRRKERKIKGASRGRVYRRKQEEQLASLPSSPAIVVDKEPVLTLVRAKVIRADGSVEVIDNG